MVCPTCGVRCTFSKHVARCVAATPEERAYYIQHRKWPRAPVSAASTKKRLDRRRIRLSPLVFESLAILVEAGDRGVRLSAFNGNARLSLLHRKLCEVRPVQGVDRVFVTVAGVARHAAERRKSVA